MSNLATLKDSKCFVKDGTTVSLKFQNCSLMTLYLAIFNFGLWGIEKIFPPDMDYFTVDPGCCVGPDDEYMLYLSSNWDTRWPNPTNCFKALITTQTTSFRSLELPKLVDDVTAPGCNSTSADFEHELEKLWDEWEADTMEALGALDTLNADSRQIMVAPSSRGKGWATAEIEICTTPQGRDEQCTISQGRDEEDSGEE